MMVQVRYLHATHPLSSLFSLFLLYHTAPHPSPPPPPPTSPPRDRSATGPSRQPPTVDTNQQISGRFQKQVSSPAGDYHPHHIPVHSTTSFLTRPEYYNTFQMSRLQSHPESEYEVGKFVAESEKDDFFQQQQER